MKITLERLNDLILSTTSPLEEKQLYFSTLNLKKQPTQRGNVFNDCQIYCEACLLEHSLLVTSEFKFVQVFSNKKAWDIFQESVGKVVSVDPVSLVFADTLIVGM